MQTTKCGLEVYIRGKYEDIFGFPFILVEIVGKTAGITIESHLDGKIRYRQRNISNIPGVWISRENALELLLNIYKKCYKQ